MFLGLLQALDNFQSSGKLMLTVFPQCFQRSLLYHYRNDLLILKYVCYAVDINIFSLFLLLDTFEIASVNLPIPVQPRNYYKSVSDNKDIVKLVSVLGTIINSTKKVGHRICSQGPLLHNMCLCEAEHHKLVLRVARVPLTVNSVSCLWYFVCTQQMFI